MWNLKIWGRCVISIIYLQRPQMLKFGPIDTENAIWKSFKSDWMFSNFSNSIDFQLDVKIKSIKLFSNFDQLFSKCLLFFFAFDWKKSNAFFFTCQILHNCGMKSMNFQNFCIQNWKRFNTFYRGRTIKSPTKTPGPP